MLWEKVQSLSRLVISVHKPDLLLEWEGLLVPQYLSCVLCGLKSCGKKGCQRKLRQKMCWVTCLLFFHCYQFLSLAYQVSGGAGEICFLWPSFLGSHACRNTSFYCLHPMPSSAPILPCSSCLPLYGAGLHPYTLPQIPAQASTACAFIFCPLVWPEVAPLLSDACLLPSWLDFLHLGIERSYTLRKTFLKISQFSFAPLFLKGVPQESMTI